MIDCAQWNEKFKDDEVYCLSNEYGISSPAKLGITGEIIDNLRASFLIKTSGSCGKSKWVIHSKNGLLEHAKLVNDHLNIGAKDVLGLMLPTYHVGGLGVIARSIVGKAKLVSYEGKWLAEIGVNFISRNKVSVVSLVPAQIFDLVHSGHNCPDFLRVVIVGGGKLEEDVRLAAIKLGWPIFESYGMTETGSQIATGKFDNGYLKLIEGWSIRVENDGFLEVKGSCLFDGYLLEKGDQIVHWDPKEDGWFKTSDRVAIKVNEEGIGVKFLSRGDRFVKILGELVDVSELESRLEKSNGTEVYLAILNDERRGASLVPVVKDMKAASQIDGLNWRGLESLEKAIVVEKFPKNEMGKLKRSKLQEMIESIVFPAD